MSFNITPQTVKARLEAGEALLIIDVRQAWELNRSRLAQAVHIPMDDIPDSLDRIPQDTPVVIMCHHGTRSAQVTQWLRAQGYQNVLNMEGGIDGWSHQVDSSIPLY